MKILIVDDEAPARSRLVRLVEEIDSTLQVVGEAENGRDALRCCEAVAPDVVLLDIRMPVMDGIDAAREMAKMAEPPAVIFTTAYEEHALDAFEVSAVDYLLKPIRNKRLEESLARAESFTSARWQELESALAPEQKARSKICLKVRNDLLLIPVEEIRFFRAEQKYVAIRDADQQYLTEESLKSLESEFGDRFLRVHRNALVACAYIEKLVKNRDGHFFIRLNGLDELIEVSRRHLPAVRAALS